MIDLKAINEIDYNNLGEAPGFIKAGIIILVISALAGAGYWFVIKDQIEELERAERTEQQLRSEFETKQRRAANLAAYEAQM